MSYPLRGQALLADPEKMKEATDKYNAMMKAQQDAAAARAEGARASVEAGATAAEGAVAAGKGTVSGRCGCLP